MDAVVLFCGRFLRLLLWTPVLRTCRLGIAEADRLSEAAAQYYKTFFTATPERLPAFLAERCQLDPPTRVDIAHELLGRTAYPRFARAVFGVEELLTELLEEHLSLPISISRQCERSSRRSSRPTRSARGSPPD